MQLLKYVPSDDDCKMLHDNLEEIDKFSRADRFMLEMSHIRHYEIRLQTMHFTKTFDERMTEVSINHSIERGSLICLIIDSTIN